MKTQLRLGLLAALHVELPSIAMCFRLNRCREAAHFWSLLPAPIAYAESVVDLAVGVGLCRLFGHSPRGYATEYATSPRYLTAREPKD